MKTTIKAFLHWYKNEWDERPAFKFYGDNMTGIGPAYALVKEMEVEVEIPDDFDPRPQQVVALRAKKQEIQAKAEVQVNNIEEQIQRLLAIDFKPEG